MHTKFNSFNCMQKPKITPDSIRSFYHLWRRPLGSSHNLKLTLFFTNFSVDHLIHPRHPQHESCQKIFNLDVSKCPQSTISLASVLYYITIKSPCNIPVFLKLSTKLGILYYYTQDCYINEVLLCLVENIRKVVMLQVLFIVM